MYVSAKLSWHAAGTPEKESGPRREILSQLISQIVLRGVSKVTTHTLARSTRCKNAVACGVTSCLSSMLLAKLGTKVVAK